MKKLILLSVLMNISVQCAEKNYPPGAQTLLIYLNKHFPSGWLPLTQSKKKHIASVMIPAMRMRMEKEQRPARKQAVNLAILRAEVLITK